MNNKKLISILMIATVAVITSIAITFMTNVYVDTQVQEQVIVKKMRSYTATEIGDVKNTSTTTTKGKILDKYTIVEFRDANGKLVDANSSDAIVTEYYLVYELKPDKTFKGDKKDIIKIKVAGGSAGNLIVESDIREYQIGQKIAVLLDGPFDNDLYQPTAGPHSIFILEKGKAIGENKNFTETELDKKLE